MANPLYDIIKASADENKLPIFSKDEWGELNASYSREAITNQLAKYIVAENPVFPLRQISYQNMVKTFNKLKIASLEGKVVTDTTDYEVKVKYDYINSFDKCGLYMIQLGHEFNDASSYFQQENRLRCNSYGYKGPLNVWQDEEALRKTNWTFWRPSMVGDNGIGSRSYRSSLRISGYVATQFKPHVAKCLFMKTNAKNVLDFSAGWGDRLVAFYCTSNTEMYFGCDPNECVFETYKKQCVEYEKLLGCENPIIREENEYFECKGVKHVVIWNRPAEDIVYPPNTFDLIFTSPPYFNTEKYNENGLGENKQSWKRYDTFENWKQNFMFKTIDLIEPSLKKGGHLMININDPQLKKERFHLCDDMVEYIKGKGLQYNGMILQRMKGRPTPKKKGGMCGKVWFGEPIWSFTK